MRSLRGWILAATLVCQAASGQDPASAVLRVSVTDPSEQPVAGVQLELRVGGRVAGTAESDSKGAASFTRNPAGRYEILATHEGFQPLVKGDLELTPNATLTVELTLVPVIVHKDSIDVQATVTPAEQVSAVPVEVQGQTVKELPSKPATVADALPMLPGVLRDPGGGLLLSAAAEHRSAMIVNSADVTDPATGQFGLTVPIDTVETMKVYQTPFLAEYGQFTAGLISVETRRGGEKFKWEINDPLPEFFIRSWHLRGLRDATPRLNFEGPILANRLYYSEGVDYEVRKTPVFTLPFPNNEKKQAGFNSFAQLDWVVSSNQLVTATAHVAPQRLESVNIDFFNPPAVAPDASTHNYTGTLSDRLTLRGGLLETVFSVTQFDAGVWGRGKANLVITPTGNSGNYFAQQDREASRIGGGSSYAFPQYHAWGSHSFKVGFDLSESSEEGQVSKTGIDLRDTQQRLLEHIAFTPGQPFLMSDFRYAYYGEDHWMLTSRLAVDLGLRVGSQEVTDSSRLAPRVGISWSPFRRGAVVHAGFGWFYDRVPLNIYGFASYPWEIQTFYGPNGAIIGGPYLFENTLGQVYRHHRLVFQGPVPGNFSPQSNIWTIEVEQPITPVLRLRAGYVQNDADGLVTVSPEGPDLSTHTGGYLLSGAGAARYRQFEVTTRYRLKNDSTLLMFSYVHSRARGDLNDFNNFLGSYPVPVIRPGLFGNLPGSVPDRFLAWGTIQLPERFRISPVVEYRNGFPYTPLNALQQYAGPPNESRFPHFLSIDSRVSKDIQINPKYAVRLSLSSFNLTNHFNPEALHSNVADPAYGYFFGHRGRRFTVDFDILF